MNLHKWNSNCLEFLRSLPTDERTTNRTSKALGLLWDWVEDTISVTGFDKVNTNLIQNSQAVKKVCGPQKGYGEKRCEIQGGGQEMAVMVG